MSGLLLYVRIVLGTAVVLAPGWAIARALGVRGVAAPLAWGLATIFGALAVTFAVSASLTLTLALLLLAGAATLPFALRSRGTRGVLPGAPAAAVLGILLGLLLWHVAGEVGGDGLFHLARVRKLTDLGDLTLDALNEFPDGSLHPGYAFPLWHGFLALVATVSGADPTQVVLHLPSVLAPLAVLAWLEAGWSLFRRPVPAAVTAAAAVALVAMSPGHGGAYTVLALPATASRQLLVPAALALALAAARRPSWRLLASAAVAAFVLAVVHPTYAIFLCIPFAGFVLVRALWRRGDVRGGALALAALALPAAAFFVWLLPVVRETASVSPDAAERLRALRQYQGQLDVRSADSFSVVPDVFGRAGLVAVAALLLVPLSGLAARRRWAAFVVGGALAVSIVALVPLVFVPFSDVVSISQARRLVGFFPFPFAVAGGMGVFAALLGPVAAPAALVAGIIIQLLYPGRLRLPDHRRWASLGHVDRGRGCHRCARGRLSPATTDRDPCSARLCAPAPAGVRARARPLVGAERARGRACSHRHSSQRFATRFPSGTPCTPIRRRATGSRPSLPSRSAFPHPGTWLTRETTARASAYGSSGASRAPATWPSRARAGPSGSLSTARGSTCAPTFRSCSAMPAGRSIGWPARSRSRLHPVSRCGRRLPARGRGRPTPGAPRR